MALERTEETASTVARGGRRVAARASDEGQEVGAAVRDQTGVVADRAKTRSRQVARATADDARALAAHVKDEASVVLEEATGQARTALQDTRQVVEQQAAQQVDRLASRLQQLAAEAEALADGRVEDAATLRDLVADTSGKLAELAERVQEMSSDIGDRGLPAALDDLQRFARRRPGMFLLGAAAAGFAAGRLARSGGDDSEPSTTGTTELAGRTNGSRTTAGAIPRRTAAAGAGRTTAGTRRNTGNGYDPVALTSGAR